MASQQTAPETLNMIRLRSDPTHAGALKLTFLNLSPDFQREYEAWDEKLCTRLIESVLLGRAMNPVWVVINEKKKCEDILDGMHRLKTLFHFINDEITIGNSLTILDKELYSGKKFCELSESDKNKISNYAVFVNRLDPSYSENRDKLHEMWIILNLSSKPLNAHEVARPLLGIVYDFIKKTFANKFLNTPLYRKRESKRCEVEGEIIKLIALTQPLPTKFNSLPAIQNKYLETTFGKTKEEVDANFEKKREEIQKICLKLQKFSAILAEALDITAKDLPRHASIPYQLLISRIVAFIDNESILRRNLPELLPKCKEIISENFGKELGKRNAQFQKHVIDTVDIFLGEIVNKAEPRKFSPTQILQKLKEQENLCTLCSKQIHQDKERYEGDHILPWTAGGKTEISNLQVVHQRCHKMKEAKLVQEVSALKKCPE